MSRPLVSRRAVLRAAGGALVAAPAVGVAGCGSGEGNKSGQNTAASNSAVKLPTYVPYEAVKPDLPGSNTGVMPAFLQFPTPKPFSTEVPGKGDEVTAMANLAGNGVPPALARNEYWQALNKRLNIDLKIRMSPNAQYPSQLQTALAGGDIPEIVGFRPVANTPDILNAKFADLTEYLSGDAIKDYPGLANIPSRSWISCVYNGGIYGIPLDTCALYREMVVRRDIVTELGLSLDDITDGASFLEFCRAVTDPKKNRYAVGWVTFTLYFLNQMNGAPNSWGEEGGKFIRDFETDAFKKSLATLTTMWKEGLFWPDTFGQVNIAELFGTGRVVMNNGGSGTAYVAYPENYRPQYPKLEVGYLVPPKWDGGGRAKYYMGPAIISPVVLRKASPDRLKYLLKILDYLASPFGTEEFTFLKYGIKDVHHTLYGTDPIKTDKGKNELTVPVRYLAAPRTVINAPGNPEASQEYHQYQVEAVTEQVDDAALGLYSPTAQSDDTRLYARMISLVGDIMQGRKPMSDWDEGVRQWRKDGGDTIRAEYEDAFAKAND